MIFLESYYYFFIFLFPSLQFAMLMVRQRFPFVLETLRFVYSPENSFFSYRGGIEPTIVPPPVKCSSVASRRHLFI